MAAYVKYQLGIEKMLEAGNAQTDTWQVILSNTAPNVATDTTAASATELSTGGGYTAGGNNAAVSSALSTGGVYKLTLADPATWTASGGGFTFRYVILYNLSLTQCIGYWDYGSAVVMNGTNADTFTADLDAANGVFTNS
jgi:hypothetical protein